MTDRWQLFEYLKRNNGCIDGADLSNMETKELMEGLYEYELYRRRELFHNVKMLQKNTSNFTQSIEEEKMLKKAENIGQNERICNAT